MIMKRFYLFLIFTIILLILPKDIIKANDSKNTVTLSSEAIHHLNMLGKDKLQQIEVRDKKVIETDEQKNKLYISLSKKLPVEKESKILDSLKNKMKSSKQDELIEVSIMVDYNIKITKEEFISKQKSRIIESIYDVKGHGGYSFFAKLNVCDIYKLAQLEEIAYISLVDDVAYVLE